MKKGIIVLLIAVLVSGFAFAGFSGYAGIQFGANLDSKDTGFANKPKAEFTFDLAADSKELTGEDLYVEFAATAKLTVIKEEGTGAAVIITDYDTGSSSYSLGMLLTIDTAKIVGDGWYVSILEAAKAADYAKAAVLKGYTGADKTAFDKQKKEDGVLVWKESASSYSVAYAKQPGVTVGYAGFKASFGFWYQGADALTAGKGYKAGTSFSATLETPEFAFNDDAIKVQAAFAASKSTKMAAKFTDPDPKAVNVGASVKGSAAIQDITVGVAADFGYQGIRTDNAKFAMDARADFAYKFVAVNVYTFVGPELAYSGDRVSAKIDDAAPHAGANASLKYYNDFYLEAKAAFDLNEFEVPLKVGITAQNIIDKSDAGIDLGASVDFEKDAIAAGASFGINLKSKEWKTTVKGKYDFEQFTAGAGVKFTGTDEISAINLGVFAETDKLIENLRFGLGYGLKAGNLMEDGGYAAIGDGAYSNDFKAEKAGVISAYGIIKF